MKLRLMIFLVIGIGMHTNICKAMTEANNLCMIMASIRKWLRACSWQAEIKEDLQNLKQKPKDSLMEEDLEKEKKTEEELKKAEKNKTEKHKELDNTLKTLCPNRYSHIWKQVKKIEAIDRLREQDPGKQNVYECISDLQKEVKQCSCNKPNLWGKIHNLFTHK